MKGLLILIALFQFTNLFSQKNIFKFPGFLITNTNDTIKAQILVTDHANNLELSDLFDQVTYLDSTGNKSTFTAYQNISTFQFTKENKTYDFERISLEEIKKKKYGFALRVVEGPVSLYLYSSNYEQYSFRPTLNPNDRSGPYTQRYIFNFLKKDGVLSLVKTYNSIKFVPGRNDKRWLKEYFRDDETLVKKIGKELDATDLEAIVKEYNLRQSDK